MTGEDLYDDLMNQAVSLRSICASDRQLVVVLGQNQYRKLAAYCEAQDERQPPQYFNGMPVFTGPVDCCSVISIEQERG